MLRSLTPAALAASLVLAPFAAAAPAPFWGPPGLCHPLDIGTAESLPMGAGPFEIDPDFDRLTTVERTLALLDAGDDVQVHMETLRRAVVYLTRDDDCFPEAAEVARLVAALEARAPGPGAKAAKTKARPAVLEDAAVLATFDLGYALGLLLETGHTPRGRAAGLESVERAVAARPDDGALRLGASIVAFSSGQDRRSYEHLESALAADDSSGLLRVNACRTMGPLLGARDHEALSAKVHAALERA